MVKDVISCTARSGMKEITMSRSMRDITASLRDFLYQHVYEGETSKKEFRKARKILFDLYHHYMDHPEEVFREFPRELTRDRRQVVCDFIAGMTDRFALRMYEEHFLPRPWMVL